jgi:hypothetical protein
MRINAASQSYRFRPPLKRMRKALRFTISNPRRRPQSAQPDTFCALIERER